MTVWRKINAGTVRLFTTPVLVHDIVDVRITKGTEITHDYLGFESVCHSRASLQEG